MLTMTFRAALLLLWPITAAAETALVGKYNPTRDLAAFQQIGSAALNTDDTGNVPVIKGSITAPDGTMIPYEALFMVCDDADTACSNLHLRREYFADKDRLFEVIDMWKATGRTPWAGYAFDKISLIEEHFGAVGSDAPNAFVAALYWRENLIVFHDLTK